jgi:hypothetical protein
MSTRSQIEFYDADATDADFGKPAARIYQHSDGYPLMEDYTPLGRLAALEKILVKGFGMYGSRENDPEWAAAEYVNQYREAGGGNIYVSQNLHGDIEYLYRVVCKSGGWNVRVFESSGHDSNYDITGWQEVREYDGKPIGSKKKAATKVKKAKAK